MTVVFVVASGLGAAIGAIHILRNRRYGGEGSPRFITVLHRGGLTDLLQYYIGVGRPIEMFFIWMISEEKNQIGPMKSQKR